tara:strand:+ start:245 stop:979 length:735 start_codon:yes stop_codon:yes gene_type:complete
MGAIENTILDGAIRLMQPEQGYRVAIDPIFLAASCFPKKGDKVLDMGCGVGSIGFCLLHFDRDIHVSGVDIQEKYIKLAVQNSEINEFSDFTEYRNIDISDISDIADVEFDHIVMNPPYYEEGTHVPSPLEDRATAHGGRLEDWISAAAKASKSGTRLYMIIPAIRFEDAQKYLKKHQFGALQLYPLFPKKNEPAKRVILIARHHKSGQMIIHNGITLHEEGRRYTNDASDILKGRSKLKGFKK